MGELAQRSPIPYESAQASEESEQQDASLEEATMSNGQRSQNWLKRKDRAEDE
jgi:hypothetical protein